MTTITFEQDIKIRKRKFKNIADFRKYVNKFQEVLQVRELDENEATPAMIRKMKETKKLSKNRFVNA